MAVTNYVAPIQSVSLPPSESIGGHVSPRDQEVWNRLEEVVGKNGHPLRHVLELFPAYIRRIHMMRFLSHYELFKHIIDLPGVIVELGVYRAPSLLTWGKLMEIFVPGDRTRRVYGFDSFKGLQDLGEKDGAPVPQIGKVEGGWSAGAVLDEVEELISITNLDNIIPNQKRVILIKGNIEETIPKFLKENPGVRISLLHLDMDLYRPTKVALEMLYPKVVTGGVVVFDEYGLIPWEGETNAADEYFKEIGIKPKIRKHHFTHVPHGYFLKDVDH
jgi:hypothetical protein